MQPRVSALLSSPASGSGYQSLARPAACAAVALHLPMRRLLPLPQTLPLPGPEDSDGAGGALGAGGKPNAQLAECLSTAGVAFVDAASNALQFQQASQVGGRRRRGRGWRAGRAGPQLSPRVHVRRHAHQPKHRTHARRSGTK